MYRIKTEDTFDAAHFLYQYDGKCKNIHGHRWKVEIQVYSEKLCEDSQSRGMVVDFSRIKGDLRELTEYFDHALIIEKGSLKEVTMKVLREEGFEMGVMDVRPTAENFAKYFFDKVTDMGYKVYMSTIYETPTNCASYTDRAV